MEFMFACLLECTMHILIGMLLQGYEIAELLDYLKFKLSVLKLLECSFSYFKLGILNSK